MDATGRLAGVDGLAILVERLENAVARGEDIGVFPRQLEDLAVAALRRCMMGPQDAQMRQYIAHAAPADLQRIDRDRSAARHLGPDRDQAGVHRLRRRGPLLAEVRDHHGHRRVEGLDRRDVALAQGGVA